ncbi:phage major capsid protein [Paraburkholderia adhaesiva]|uniref:phage major capsid protein n=1 Tax=Paraburkholderia adhaesiva TaxID=2883244 RepID=UPI001F267193|nr:phage major capsid protein [Paraburkholderia adhaesiva]
MARLDFVRACKAIAIKKGDVFNAKDWALNAYGSRSAVTAYLTKAAQPVTSASINDPDAPASLRDAEFIGLIQRRSVIALVDEALGGGGNGWRRVPPFVPLLLQLNGASAGWVPEGALKFVGNANFDVSVLIPKKLAAMLVASIEFVKELDETTDLALQPDLARAVSDEINRTLVSNDTVTNASPGGLFVGIEPLDSTGTLDGDVEQLVDSFPGDFSSAVLLASPRAGVGFAFSGHDQTAGARGGYVAGIPLVTVPGLPDGTLALIDARRVVLYEGETVPGASQQSAVTFTDADGATQLVSLWQNNLVGLRTETFVNWIPLDGCGVWINDATLPGEPDGSANGKRTARRTKAVA